MYSSPHEPPTPNRTITTNHPPQGVSTHIKLKAAGELQLSGKREVFFEANGVPRVVEVTDTRSADTLIKKAVREKVGGWFSVWGGCDSRCKVGRRHCRVWISRLLLN